MRDIARRANITTPGLRYHFATKAELFAAVFAERDALGLATSVEVRHAGGTPADVIAEVLRRSQEDPPLVRAWLAVTAAASDPAHPLHDLVAQRYAVHRAGVEERLRDAQAAGALARGVEPDEAAALLLAVFNGLQAQWMLDPHLDVLAAVRSFASLLLSGGSPP